MPAAPLPANEKERLLALGRYSILDTLPEAQYDDITFLATQICKVPISAISLIDKDRQWFKSIVGIDATETPREVSFCAHTILGEGILEVPDATLDPRFSDNPVVIGTPQVRFYAGAPLRSPDGLALGSLCVVSPQPGHLSPAQKHALEALARQVVSQLELHRTVARLEVADKGRAQAMAHLAANSLILRQFVQHAPASIAMLDHNLRYLAVSQRFLQDHALQNTDVCGQSHLELFPSLPASWIKAYEVALRGESTICECEEVRKHNGEIAFVKWETLPWRGANGAIGGVITLTEDVTSRILAERLKGEFVSVVSHELRTPLTSIRGALGLLENGIVGSLPPRASEMVSIAQKNAERLVLLINDLLDIDKIESGQMRFDFQTIELSVVLAAALEVNRHYGEPLGVALRGEMPAKKVWVRADEGRLAQVLANLISNACKFSPKGGEVRLRAQEMQVKDESWVRVCVVDEGEGVPAPFVPRLFERFAQADSSATRKKNGTGLGLAVARAIVEKHGGRIGYLPPDAPDSLTTGATFFFDLPLAEEEN